MNDIVCPRDGMKLISILDDLVCPKCGFYLSGGFNAVGGESSAPIPSSTTSSAKAPLAFSLGAGDPKPTAEVEGQRLPQFILTKHDLQKLMMGSCPSEEAAPEGLPYSDHRDPGSAVQCITPQSSPSNARCFPETQRKQWPSQKVIVDAIINGKNVRCPFYIGGQQPCEKDPRAWVWCDGNIVTAGVACEKRKEDI